MSAQLPLFDDMPPSQAVVNVASVPQRSVFRYPGGKTWFVPYARQWLSSFALRPSVLIEPFAGGGIIGLTAAFESLADQVVLVEFDTEIAAVWKTILSEEAHWLGDRIVDFLLTSQNVTVELEREPRTTRERAFQTILKNRINRGGIMAPGAGKIKNGENGRGLDSRWYPETLRRRIRDIYALRDRIVFIEGDGISVISQYKDNPNVAYFVDPPYTAGGKRAGSRLYKHAEIDHSLLFTSLKAVNGNVLMTYDEADEVRKLADTNGFSYRSVAMKNTHHSKMCELVVSRDVSWLDQ